MDDIKTIRRRNLKAIIAELGTSAALARLLGGDFNNRTSHIAQIVGKNPNRDVGDDFAREVEVAAGKLQNWMDRDHSAPDASTRRFRGLRARAINVISWAQAGRFPSMDVAETSEDSKLVYTSDDIGDDSFALRVRGDTMVDAGGPHSYPAGAIIIVDPSRRAKPGDRVIVKLALAEEPVFRQWEQEGGQSFLKPLNSRYPITLMPPDARVIGVVVQTQINE